MIRLSPKIEIYKRSLDGRHSIFSSQSGNSHSSHSRVRLTKIQFQFIFGCYTGWMSFADRFKAPVDSNAEPTESEKLNHLEACIKRDAARLIMSISIIDQNSYLALKLRPER